MEYGASVRVLRPVPRWSKVIDREALAEELDLIAPERAQAAEPRDQQQWRAAPVVS